MKTFKIWFQENNQNKIKMLYICRGISGSGKSFLSKQLAGNTGIVLSTDDFFYNSEGKYDFNFKLLAVNHMKNQQRAEEEMKKGTNPIVIDNTNIRGYEAKKYVQLAQEFGYQVEFSEPNTPWKFDSVELTKRNQHGVPKDAIDRMIKNWEPDLTVDKVLQSKAPWE